MTKYCAVNAVILLLIKLTDLHIYKAADMLITILPDLRMYRAYSDLQFK